MDSKQWNYISLAIVLVLVAVSFFLFFPPQQKIRQGLDIRGGLSVLLTAEGNVAPGAIDRALTIVSNRVNGLGVSEATVQKESDNALLVQLPGIKDPKQALAALGSTGQLEFVEVSSLPTTIQAEIQAANTKGAAQQYKLAKGSYTPVLTGDVITNAAATANTGAGAAAGTYAVSMSFDSSGSAAWSKITARNIGKQVAIVLDGTVVSAPVVEGVIPNGQSEITGSFTAAEANNLATILQFGALPVTLKFSDTREVGPTLGQASLVQGLYAAVAGIILVGIYLAIYYRGLGVLSWVGLALFTLLYLGVLGLLSSLGAFALSLPGIAGIVLSIGLAADTFVLIFERFKEEVVLGKSVRSAAKSGSWHALMTSLDADVVTLVSALALFAIAVGPVRGFALTLILGLACDLTIGFLFTRPTVMLLSESVIPKHRTLFGLKGGAADA
jgi:preprotein translocase subunit SecD